MGGNVVRVFERVDHGFLLALLIETSLAVGIDATLRDDISAGTS